MNQDTNNALALARELDTKARALGCPLDRFSDALRQQHTRIAELEAQLYAVGAGGVGQSIKPQVQADTPQPTAADQEPAATVQTINGVTIGYLETRLPDGTKLYAAPQPARQPLTNEQIIAIADNARAAESGDAGYILPIAFARAIEAAYGITGGQP